MSTPALAIRQPNAQPRAEKAIGGARYFFSIAFAPLVGLDAKSDARIASYHVRYALKLISKGSYKRAAAHYATAADTTRNKLDAGKFHMEAGSNLEYAATNRLIRIPAEQRETADVKGRMAEFYAEMITQYGLAKAKLTEAQVACVGFEQDHQIRGLLEKVDQKISSAERIRASNGWN